jgi:enoyl-CoA hydratase/carnithine racemase
MTVESEDLIRLSCEGDVATVWLNRPSKRNAMNYAMWSSLEQVASHAAADRAVRVVVLRGAGDHFCAGADITELNVERGGDERSFSQVVGAAETTLAGILKPTVAFISGDCVGGGCSLAIDCDIRLATPDARFGITPAKLGIVYPSAALERAAHLLGPAATKRLLFTAELIDADQARHIGLVDEIVDPSEAEQRLAALTAALAARSLLTQAATKAMVGDVMTYGHVRPEVDDHWKEVVARAADSGEGIAAFIEKRPPRFTWTGVDG